MEKEALLLKSVSELVLDLFTIEELKKRHMKPTKFEWKFNSNNINVIPILELYNNNGIYKTFESIEFPEKLQKLLKEVQMLSKYTDSNLDKHFLSYLEESTADCSKCGFRKICHLKDDKE